MALKDGQGDSELCYKSDGTLKSDTGKSPEGKLIGNESHIVSSISRFYNNEELSDITLKLGTQRYHAHRFVLVLMSDVFRTLCSQRWSSEEDLVKEVELIESELCAPVFPVFLHFLYHGTVFVNTSTALPLLMLADKYNVQPLKTSCEEYVYSQIKEGKVVGAIRWLPYLQLCGHSELKEACVEVIAIEMEFVLKCTDFLLLTIDFLVQLLSRNDLVVSTEYNLYVGVLSWISSNDNDNFQTSCSLLQTLLPLIRFSMMFPEQLLQIEKSDFYRARTEVMKPYLANAHRYRSLAGEASDESFAMCDYQPRNYTHNLWCHYIYLETDNSCFYPKTINSYITHGVVVSLNGNKDPRWQINVGRNPDDDKKGHKPSFSRSFSEVNAAGQGIWKFSFNSFPDASNSQSKSIQLILSVKLLHRLREDVAIDISLFLVKKDVITKYLATKTIYGHNTYENKKKFEVVLHGRGTGNGVKLRTAGSSNSSTSSSGQQQSPRLFQPSPMHFSFVPFHTKHEPDVIINYDFPRDWLDQSPEAPCVSFGPQFTTTPRPIHSVWVAVIAKPRLKTPEEMVSVSTTADESNPSSPDDDDDGSMTPPPNEDVFPILG